MTPNAITINIFEPMPEGYVKISSITRDGSEGDFLKTQCIQGRYPKTYPVYQRITRPDRTKGLLWVHKPTALHMLEMRKKGIILGSNRKKASKKEKRQPTTSVQQPNLPNMEAQADYKNKFLKELESMRKGIWATHNIIEKWIKEQRPAVPTITEEKESMPGGLPSGINPNPCVNGV